MPNYIPVQIPIRVPMTELLAFADRLGLTPRRMSDGSLRFIDPKNPPDNVRRLPARPRSSGPNMGGAA